MLDLAWSEIALILLVALVVIGPKELPNAVRGVADFVRKARRMAGEFQVHVDEMMRESKLDEVKKQIDEVRTGIYDMRRDVERAVDEHDIRDAFKDPFAETPGPFTGTSTGTSSGASMGASAAPAAEPATAPPPRLERGPPAFVPPAFVPPAAASPAHAPPAYAPPAYAPPAFVPPATLPPASAPAAAAAPMPVAAATRDNA